MTLFPNPLHAISIHVPSSHHLYMSLCNAPPPYSPCYPHYPLSSLCNHLFHVAVFMSSGFPQYTSHFFDIIHVTFRCSHVFTSPTVHHIIPSLVYYLSYLPLALQLSQTLFFIFIPLIHCYSNYPPLPLHLN